MSTMGTGKIPRAYASDRIGEKNGQRLRPGCAIRHHDMVAHGLIKLHPSPGCH